MLRTRRLSCISQLTAVRTTRRSEGPNGGCLDGYEIAWATAADACPASAVTRVLGATPAEVSVGIAAAQALPALAGAVLGIPAGAALSAVLSGPGSVIPPAWWLAVVVLAAVTAVAVLTFIPSRPAGRTGPAPVLQAGPGQAYEVSERNAIAAVFCPPLPDKLESTRQLITGEAS
jgi:hypothetical protein